MASAFEYKHDIRREFQRRGQLNDLPLILDDYEAENDESRQMASDINRRLYAPIHAEREAPNGGGGGSNSDTSSSRQSETLSVPPGSPTRLVTEEGQS